MVSPGETYTGPKNSKEYWKQAYASSKQSGQTVCKRKHDSNAGDDEQAKRHQGEHANKASGVLASPDSHLDDTESSGYAPTVSTVGQANSPTRSDGLDHKKEDTRVQQFLKVDVNLDDPQACRDLHRLHNAVASFGQDRCRLGENNKWRLDNFRTSLYQHQVIGVSWMLSRELHPAAPAGCILADEMGLGKTVQLLACMSQNIPAKKSKANQTLIIVPKRLITQWYNEIRAHCSHKSMKSVFIYTASGVMMDAQWKDHNIM